MLKIFIITIFFQFLFLTKPGAQQTNTRAAGRVISDEKEILDGSTITAIHTPTGDKYISIANNGGYFRFFNLKPGGPYTLIFSFTGYDTLEQSNLFVHLGSDHFNLGETEIIDFLLHRQIKVMEDVLVSAPKITRIKSGVETNISAFTLKSMPSISRSFQDFIRLVPQAKVNGDGVMSLAGQNNRFNAFFIDGANNSDVQGIAVNGMNGGQTGSPPVSIEAIEEINILQAPYDVQYGNFTGGSINAISRSGTNENKSSAWYFFRNEKLAGRSPVPLEKQDAPGEYSYPRLPGFVNQTIGAWNSGTLKKNKLFYFVLFEKQSDRRPQVFNMDEYAGNSNQQQLFELTNFIKNTYQYDPGSFIETIDDLNATRMNVKLDWNVSVKDKFSLAYRNNNAERISPRLPNSASSISFQNNGFGFQTRTNSAVFEWKRFFKNNINNRMVLNFTDQIDDRKFIGQAFPTVTVIDGVAGTINFGSDATGGGSLLKAKELTLFDAFMLDIKNHLFTTGIDMGYTILDNISIPAFFGQYQFRSVEEFMNIAPPSRYQRYFPLTETHENPSRFNTVRGSFFLNDEVRPAKHLKMNLGLRLDVNSIPSKPLEDKFFNDTAIHIISGYYNMAGAVSGQPMKPHWQLSPRIGLDYRLAKYNIIFRAGAGYFLGHIVNFWQFDVFNNNNGLIDVSNPPRFEPDPYHQPGYQELRTYPYKDLVVMARKFKYPTVLRTSFVMEKQFKNRWGISMEGIFTKNIHEVAFQNINIVPPSQKSSGPGSRNVYSAGSGPDKIILSTNGIQNPYSGIYLVSNNSGKKGSAYSFSFNIQKQAKTFSFNSSYTYGNSSLLFEITGPQTPARSQWRNMETVNGRNFANLSTSDNALQHRVISWITKTFTYAKRKVSTSVSLFYNGQSGVAFSYVYSNSMINDNGRRGENFDLIYIPTLNDLASMNFLPITGNTNQVLYTAEQQAYYLNSFIENDKYLKKHRGEFSTRNGARLPFTQTVDLRLQQDFKIKWNQKVVGLAITFDVFNFTNMLNRDWGRIYYLTNDSYPLLQFAGYSNPSNLTPQYQFKPVEGDPWSLQPSTLPGNSARWISQLGLKINLD